MDYFYIDNLDKLNKFSLPAVEKIHFLIYNICLEKSIPFMQVLLTKENDELLLPSFNNKSNKSVKNIIYGALQYINEFSNNNYNESNLSYDGYYVFDDEIICFIDCNQIDVTNKYYIRNDVLFFFPWTEIIYEKQCKINKKSLVLSKHLFRNFQIKNTQTHEVFQSPLIGYSLSSFEQAKFINIFGESCSVLPVGRLFKLHSDKQQVLEEYKSQDHNVSWCVNKIALFGKSVAVHKNDFSISLFEKYDIIICNSSEKSYLFFMDRDIQLPLSSYKL